MSKNFRNISIIIPAYNEVENLPVLCKKIVSKYPKIRVVVVDDSDKAENLRLKRSLLKYGRQISVISRLRKSGRGSAVIDGLRLALRDKKVDVFFEMDADLAHDPDEIPLFLHAIDSDKADMVIGSRYRLGSNIVKWPKKRLIQSKIINLFLNFWLGLKVTDYTNGFRAYSRKSADFLVRNRKSLKEKGFIMLSEIAFRLKKAGYKISETPITFRDRKYGRSSANFDELISSLFGAIRIRLSNISPFFFWALAIPFIYFNYSYSVWNIVNTHFGLVIAKVLPEVIGLLFFAVLSIIYLFTFYPNRKTKIDKSIYFVLMFLIFASLVFHFKQFNMYFWKDDFYYFLNRAGTSYSFYQWGPWLSSYSLWVWELIRALFGFSIFPYNLATILSHTILGFGVFLLARYLSKNTIVGILTSLLIVSTSVTFEAFQWLTQPVNFAWQVFVLCLALISLVWEMEVDNRRKLPYLSSFVMMSAFGAGIARIGFILPLVTSVSFFISVKQLKLVNFWSWVVRFVKVQLIFYLLAGAFFVTRHLYEVHATKVEIVTAPLYRIYFYLVGVSSMPVEFFVGLSKISQSLAHPVLPGVLIVWFGIFFTALIIVFVLVLHLKNSRLSTLFNVGVFWLIFSSMFYAPFAPHLPASNYQINISHDTHHLSYLVFVGAAIIWGIFLYKVTLLFFRLRKPFGHLFSVSIISSILIVNYILLTGQYNRFLDLPNGVNVTRQQFFFDTYRKYIPQDAKEINIFYDNGALIRKDNYKPNFYYYSAFWNPEKVRILSGDSDLKDYIKAIKGSQAKEDFIDNLSYIYTAYDYGLIEENLSSVLRDSVRRPVSQSLRDASFVSFWGMRNGNSFLPEVFRGSISKVGYFRNPVIVVNNLEFPSILTPKLNLKVDMHVVNNENFVDLRAGVFSQLLNNWSLPSDDQLQSLVKYYSEKPSEGDIELRNILNTPYVADKMVCDQEIYDDGVTFLIVWSGEPDSYLKSHYRSSNTLMSGYLDRYYSICSFPKTNGVKEINVSLPNLGSILRQIVIIPLTKQPISMKMVDAKLSTPKILE